MSDLNPLFRPRSVALIGASSDPKKYGYWTAKGLIDSQFTGDLYFISRTAAADILGQKPYASISDVPGSVDLAILGISPKYILPVIQECADKGVKAVVVVATGFGETGPEGKALEQKMIAIAQKTGMRIMGPNCMGIFSSPVNLNASTIDLDDGHMGLVLQSGNFGIDINFNAKTRGLGYSGWASIGNQADLRFADFVEYLGQDEDTRVVLMYMEGLRVSSVDDGRNFLRKARLTTLQKPVAVIKIGRSKAGARAAASHTGSLAGSENIFDAALNQAGVIRVETPNELLDVGEAFSRCKMPKGNRIAILTDGGGHGVMATDMAENLGLNAAVLSEETQKKLRAILKPHCPIKNPVDLAGTPEGDMWVFDRCAEVLLADPDVDGLVIAGLYGGYCDFSEEFRQLEMDVAKSLADRATKADKPVVMHSMYHAQQPESLVHIMKHGFPVYGSVDAAMRAMGALVGFGARQGKIQEELAAQPPQLPEDRLAQVQIIFDKVRSQNRVNLVETEAREVLRAYGFNLPSHLLATNENEAATLFDELGAKKVVMKIVSPDILHKTDAGGVILNVDSEEKARDAYIQLLSNAKKYDANADIFGVMLTPMLSGGVECIIGSSYDSTFGPAVMFGLGGIFVEVLKDVSFRVAPVNGPEAKRMISEINAYPLLTGVRGQQGVNLSALENAVSMLSYMVVELSDVAEVDLNPVFATEDGVDVVDARIVLHPVNK
ncbi:CoA-binding protein [Pseudodesulfovibrio sp. JC047]|uniref:acetate--CoA ligase family protein n=1 Tax=Pseudodesulfovibrio sp. JC047 TaxID=2683199 RepID=UPI0013D5979A|nr:acetate--CoA ligase family protein [Pseudodesulfovibrio sp. JC047]NDV19487.1 CoA-binding protein [Pseudodesulfovibrio sp. JC047]